MNMEEVQEALDKCNEIAKPILKKTLTISITILFLNCLYAIWMYQLKSKLIYLTILFFIVGIGYAIFGYQKIIKASEPYRIKCPHCKQQFGLEWLHKILKTKTCYMCKKKITKSEV